MTSWILTCEHAGYAIPEWLQGIFEVPTNTLISHEGWDIGAWQVALSLAKNMKWPLYGYPYTRLLVESNRSLQHPKLFSKWSKKLDPSLQARALNYLYHPFRRIVKEEIRRVITHRGVIHLSIHSFTPIFRGSSRSADIGILYDPQTRFEGQLARLLQKHLKAQGWKLRLNYPYLGKSDGHVRGLRQEFPEHYVGLEIEINQRLIMNQVSSKRLAQQLQLALKQVTKELSMNGFLHDI